MNAPTVLQELALGSTQTPPRFSATFDPATMAEIRRASLLDPANQREFSRMHGAIAALGCAACSVRP